MQEQIAVEPNKKIRVANGSAPENQGSEMPGARSRAEELEAALIEMQAKNQQLQFLLSEAQATIGQLITDKERLAEEVKELKQKPFKSGKKSETKPAKKQGRPKGGQGRGRKRPEQVDYSEFISAGEQCPDCAHAFSGNGVERERTIEDIEPIRPTIVTRYIIERVLSNGVCKRRASVQVDINILGVIRHPILETDSQLIEDQGPVGNRHGPFFGDVFIGQEKQLSDRFGRRKNRRGLGHFA